MLTVAFTTGEQMKEQYLGDVSDYRKYALLRALTATTGLRLGVCWMLTPDDGRSDGNKLEFLSDPAKWRALDPELFDLLAEIVAKPESRRLNAIELSGMLGRQTVFFDQVVSDGGVARRTYSAEAKRHLAQCDLVFFDPDNGLEVSSVRKGRKNSSKYLYLDEAAEMWASGASLLIYQHYIRENRQAFEARVADRLVAVLPSCQISLFATADALFILAAQPHHRFAFAKSLSQESMDWPDWFIATISADRLPASEVPSPRKLDVSQANRRSADPPMIKEVCEVKALGSTWKNTGIEDALPQRGKVHMRCVECHGEVKPHRAWKNGRNRAHFEHVQKHTGCSYSRHFIGVRTKHPLPLM